MKDSDWTTDIFGDGFEMTYVNQSSDYSGAIRCTVIRKLSAQPSQKAILYIHGFSDYFLQKEMAQMFIDHGYNFYAIDLRKYGRSLMKGQRMFQVRDLHEYFPDIDSAVKIMANDNNCEIAMLGHSTGGLTASLYMSETPSALIKALMLNSPFLDWNMPAYMKKIIVPAISMLGRLFPNIRVHQKPDTGYAETLSNRYDGEWDYRDDWKPDSLPNPDMGWIRAIDKGQRQLRRQTVKVPILLMHSSASVNKGDPEDKYFHADAILNVDTISYYGLRLGSDITEVAFDDGLHDLALSKKTVREHMYKTMLEWLGFTLPSQATTK